MTGTNSQKLHHQPKNDMRKAIERQQESRRTLSLNNNAGSQYSQHDKNEHNSTDEGTWGDDFWVRDPETAEWVRDTVQQPEGTDADIIARNFWIKDGRCGEPVRGFNRHMWRVPVEKRCCGGAAIGWAGAAEGVGRHNERISRPQSSRLLGKRKRNDAAGRCLAVGGVTNMALLPACGILSNVDEKAVREMGMDNVHCNGTQKNVLFYLRVLWCWFFLR